MVEEWKWRGVPVWSHDGIICTGETYKTHVKLTFARGAALDDPAGLFNASLEGNTRRAIDIREGETIDARRCRPLPAAVSLNAAARAAAKRACSGLPRRLLTDGRRGAARRAANMNPSDFDSDSGSLCAKQVLRTPVFRTRGQLTFRLSPTRACCSVAPAMNRGNSTCASQVSGMHGRATLPRRRASSRVGFAGDTLNTARMYLN